MRRQIWLLLLTALLTSTTALPLRASAESAAVPSRTLVKVAFNKQLKRSILVDSRGLTLYMYTSDSPGEPACYNDPTYHCSKAWPPLLTTGAPRAGKGVKASLLGVAKRTGGGLQVTYNGHPLYGNAGAKAFGLVADKKPGDINGHRFITSWFVLSPAGKPIRS